MLSSSSSSSVPAPSVPTLPFTESQAPQQKRASSSGQAAAPRVFGKYALKKKSLHQVLSPAIQSLIKKDVYGIFLEPVDTKLIPDYLQVIQEPMDFGTIRKRIDQRSYYRDFGQFQRDVQLTCRNAMKYNSPDTIYHKEAQKILQYAEKQFLRLQGQIDPTLTDAPISTTKKTGRRARAAAAAGEDMGSRDSASPALGIPPGGIIVPASTVSTHPSSSLHVAGTISTGPRQHGKRTKLGRPKKEELIRKKKWFAGDGSVIWIYDEGHEWFTLPQLSWPFSWVPRGQFHPLDKPDEMAAAMEALPERKYVDYGPYQTQALNTQFGPTLPSFPPFAPSDVAFIELIYSEPMGHAYVKSVQDFLGIQDRGTTREKKEGEESNMGEESKMEKKEEDSEETVQGTGAPSSLQPFYDKFMQWLTLGGHHLSVAVQQAMDRVDMASQDSDMTAFDPTSDQNAIHVDLPPNALAPSDPSLLDAYLQRLYDWFQLKRQYPAFFCTSKTALLEELGKLVPALDISVMNPEQITQLLDEVDQVLMGTTGEEGLSMLTGDIVESVRKKIEILSTASGLLSTASMNRSSAGGRPSLSAPSAVPPSSASALMNGRASQQPSPPNPSLPPT